jgi:hypothetical protein
MGVVTREVNAQHRMGWLDIAAAYLRTAFHLRSNRVARDIKSILWIAICDHVWVDLKLDHISAAA